LDGWRWAVGGPVKEGPVKEGPVKEGPVKEGPVKEGPVKEGAEERVTGAGSAADDSLDTSGVALDSGTLTEAAPSVSSSPPTPP
jgi:hypothetical protein